MKPFIKDLTFRAEKKLPKANLHLFQNLKKNLYFFLKNRNVSFENIMFLSRFPIFFNPFDNIWVFHNLPSLNSIILLLMFIFYLLRYYCQLHFFLTFFLADAWLHPITIFVSWIFNSHTYFKDTQLWLYTLMVLHVL